MVKISIVAWYPKDFNVGLKCSARSDRARDASHEPADVEGFIGQIARILTDIELRRDLRERGLTQVARFSRDRTARVTTAVYKRVAG